MKVYTKELPLETNKQFEVLNITNKVALVVKESGIQDGFVIIQCPHTTASIRINHFEPLLLQDMLKIMYRLAPSDANYSHDVFELRDSPAINERTNGHAHIKAFLLGSSESIIVKQGEMLLGPKQSVMFVEFDGGRVRKAQVQVIGT